MELDTKRKDPVSFPRSNRGDRIMTTQSRGRDLILVAQVRDNQITKDVCTPQA